MLRLKVVVILMELNAIIANDCVCCYSCMCVCAISDVKKAIVAQAIGGIFFSIFGGQPMIILLTTVPLAIYIKGRLMAVPVDNIYI